MIAAALLISAVTAAQPVPDLVIQERFTIYVDTSDASLACINELAEVATITVRRPRVGQTKRLPVIAFKTQFGDRNVCGWTGWSEFAEAYIRAKNKSGSPAVQTLGPTTQTAVPQNTAALPRTPAVRRARPLRLFSACPT